MHFDGDRAVSDGDGVGYVVEDGNGNGNTIGDGEKYVDGAVMGTEPFLCFSGITPPMATTTPMLTAKVTPLPKTPIANLRNTMDVANVSGRGVIVEGGTDGW